MWKVAQKEYKRRYDNVAKIVHWKFCGKCNLKRIEKWYEYAPGSVVEKGKSEDFVGFYDPMRQGYQGKETKYSYSE